MDLFSVDLDRISITDIEDFLAISAPEEQWPSEGVKIDYGWGRYLPGIGVSADRFGVV
jgi:hypothetical protein